MVWDNEKDEYLCREVLLFEPHLHKPRTVARGNAWKVIAAQLTTAPLSFKVRCTSCKREVCWIG